MENNNKVKLKVKEVAKAKKKTLQDIADYMGVTKQSLSQTISNGNPKLNSLVGMARALGCRIQDLVETDDDQIIECPICGTRINKDTGTKVKA